MSFLMIISYGMDGFSYAMEAMVGKTVIGAKDKDGNRWSLIGTFFLELQYLFGTLTIVFAIAGSGSPQSQQLNSG